MEAVPFADIEVGQVLPTQRYEVGAEEVARYVAAVGGTAQLPAGEAPPTFATVYLRDVRRLLPAPPGGVHAAQRFRFHAPIRVGDRITVTTRVAETYVRRERNHVVLETEIARADGTSLCSGRSVRIWAR